MLEPGALDVNVHPEPQTNLTLSDQAAAATRPGSVGGDISRMSVARVQAGASSAKMETLAPDEQRKRTCGLLLLAECSSVSASKRSAAHC